MDACGIHRFHHSSIRMHSHPYLFLFIHSHVLGANGESTDGPPTISQHPRMARAIHRSCHLLIPTDSPGYLWILQFLDTHGWPGPSMDSATPRLHKGHIFSSIKSATTPKIKLLLCLKFWRQYCSIVPILLAVILPTAIAYNIKSIRHIPTTSYTDCTHPHH